MQRMVGALRRSITHLRSSTALSASGSPSGSVLQVMRETTMVSTLCCESEPTRRAGHRCSSLVSRPCSNFSLCLPRIPLPPARSAHGVAYLKVEHTLSNLLRFRQPVVLGQPVHSFLEASPEVSHGPLSLLRAVGHENDVEHVGPAIGPPKQFLVKK